MSRAQPPFSPDRSIAFPSRHVMQAEDINAAGHDGSIGDDSSVGDILDGMALAEVLNNVLARNAHLEPAMQRASLTYLAQRLGRGGPELLDAARSLLLDQIDERERRGLQTEGFALQMDLLQALNAVRDAALLETRLAGLNTTSPEASA